MFGVIMAERRGVGDQVLSSLSARLQLRGVRVCGAVQDNVVTPGTDHCAMDLAILGTPRTLRISQNLGPGATGCRMDSGALEDVVGLVGTMMEGGYDLLLVNKFGKAEAEGRGFRPLIAAALAAGKPVLTCVKPANRAAFDAFAGGLATDLSPDAATLDRWVGEVLAQLGAN